MDTTLDYYNKFPNDFEKLPFDKVLPDLFKKHVKGINVIDVLDLGCGPGALASWLKTQGYNVLCLDPSEEMINACLQKGLKSMQGTLDDTDFNYKFQVIFALSCLIHIDEESFKRNLKKIHSLLAKENLFMISMLIGEGQKSEDPKNKGVNRTFHYYSKETLEALFSEFGFKVVEKTLIDSSMNKTFGLFALKKA